MTDTTRLAAELRVFSVELGLELDAGQVSQLLDYAHLVCKWQRIANLTGAGSPAQFVRDHINDCLAVVPSIGDGRLLDVGSGAGLPGVVIAIARPELEITLLEPRSKRARFLTQVCIDLKLARTTVIAERLEDFRPTSAYHQVTSRAFSSLADFVHACAALREAGAHLLAMKGALDGGEVAAASALAGPAAIIELRVPGFTNRHLVVFAPGSAAGSN